MILFIISPLLHYLFSLYSILYYTIIYRYLSHHTINLCQSTNKYFNFVSYLCKESKQRPNDSVYTPDKTKDGREKLYEHGTTKDYNQPRPTSRHQGRNRRENRKRTFHLGRLQHTQTLPSSFRRRDTV